MMDFNSLVTALTSNAVNWVLLCADLLLLKELLAPLPQSPTPVMQDPILLRNFTLKSLRVFGGTTPNTPILVGVNGKVYDVSRGAQFYGPGAAYGNFGGRDASRALAKHSFDESMFTDEPDSLSDLTPIEWETLRDWQGHFENKYDHVGFLVNDKGE